MALIKGASQKVARKATIYAFPIIMNAKAAQPV